ncbi:hypothetical protein AB0K23_11425 [Streptomyces sp. NPDC049602]
MRLTANPAPWPTVPYAVPVHGHTVHAGWFTEQAHDRMILLSCSLGRAADGCRVRPRKRPRHRSGHVRGEHGRPRPSGGARSGGRSGGGPRAVPAEAGTSRRRGAHAAPAAEHAEVTDGVRGRSLYLPAPYENSTDGAARITAA